MITQHQSQCVMNDMKSLSPILTQGINPSDTIIIESDDDDDDVISINNNDQSVVQSEETKNDLNMYESIETIDDNSQQSVEQIRMNEADGVNDGGFEEKEVVIDYFDGIDDEIFIECTEFDTTGFVNDDEILRILKETEEKIKMKDEIQKQIDAQNEEIEKLKAKESEIKEQRLRLEHKARDLEHKLKSIV